MNPEQTQGASPEEIVEAVEASEEIREIRRRNLVHMMYQRLIAGPGGSVLLHLLLVLVLLKVTVDSTSTHTASMELKLVTPDTVEMPEQKMEEVLKTPEMTPTEIRPEENNLAVNMTPQDVMVLGDPLTGDPTAKGSGGSDGNTAGIGSGLGTDAGFEISVVRSPMVMRGLYASRTAGGRKGALEQYGGGIGGSMTENAVLRALRWLKKNQASDGSWPSHKPASTGFALLAFLAHGETPSSEEFGETVEKAIRWLIEHRDKQGGYPRSYEHPIATYALCEAYGLTRIPMIKEAAEQAIEILIQGQNPKGGWRYSLTPKDESDSTVMSWCVQAVKAAKMAGLDNSGLDNTLKKAIEGFKGNYQDGIDKGGFGYTSPGMSGLTGAGVLCLQLLGQGNCKEVKKGLVYLDEATFNWEGGGSIFNKNYYWYYITQAKFHAGGDRWDKWNKIFAPTLVKHQTILKGEYTDHAGASKDIGFWDMDKTISGPTDGVVMNTALCTLQLEVYYRYLPTYKPPEKEPDLTLGDKANNVNVEIR